MSVFKELWEYRDIFYFFTLRIIKVRYKQTLLGIIWVILTPLTMMFIFNFVFSKIVRLPLKNVPYPVFVYCGLLAWTFFSSSLSAMVISLVDNVNLITKIYFPREILPLSSLASKLVDFLFTFLILLGLMLFYRMRFHPTFLLFPFFLAIQIIFTLGVGFLLALGNLFFRDIQYIFNVLIVLWMFLSSVIYPLEATNPAIKILVFLNPMTLLINSYREVILMGQVPPAENTVMAVFLSLLALLTGWGLFRKYEPLFAEYI
jgi:ABC-type polysaccharide/polyol phosphate export permease